MRSYLKYFFGVLFIMIATTCIAGLVMADDLTTLPADQFLSQVMTFIKAFGGLPWMGKVAGVTMLIVASFKVSFMQPLWSKLGKWQVFAPLVLALAGGVLSMSPFTLPGLMAYMFAGAGAVVLHELLDAAKAIPGLGPMYVSAINFVENLPIFGAKS